MHGLRTSIAEADAHATRGRSRNKLGAARTALLSEQPPLELPCVDTEGEGVWGPAAPRGVHDFLIACWVEDRDVLGHLRHLRVDAIDIVIKVPWKLPCLDDLWRANDPLSLPLYWAVRE